MSTEHPVQAPPAEAVIEFGGGPEEDTPSPRGRRSLTELTRELAADRRTVPLAAVVGAVALFASLISEWQITVLDTSQFGESQGGNRPLPAGVTDLGALGSGYVVGLFALAGAVVLVLFGPPAGRRHVRLLGMTAAGVLLGLLAALASSLGASSRALSSVYTFDLDDDQIQLTYGRGIWCAFLGVLAVLLALWLAGRHLPPDTPIVVAKDEPEEPVEAAPPPGPVVWSWRRPAKEEPADDEEQPDAPIDLTVSSTTPFTLRDEDRDKAVKRDDPP
jgi:hypothetical protein